MEPIAAASGSSSLASAKLEWQGVASCAATACHGGNGPKGSKGSEYTTWVLYDKHTKAYLVLFDDRSQIIEKNYRRLKSVKEAHAEQDTLCLRCHAMNADNGRKSEMFVRDFGVGCESCHGVAEKWLGAHYSRDWKSKLEAKAEETRGFEPMKQLADRATVCVRCHVGHPEKEVNHDLIAAGHPRLNFEFGAFHAMMPKHWQEVRDNAKPDFEARAWAVGQVVTAKAALALLEHRAKTRSSPWPEFAEYECFACHHDLREPSWRQEPGHYGNRKPGSLPWGTWYYPMLSQALRSAGMDDTQVTSILGELAKEMQKPSPNRSQIEKRLRETEMKSKLDRLAVEMEKAPYQRAALEELFNSIRRDEQKVAATSWDGAAQLYLALAALYNALGDIDQGRRDPALRDWLKARAKQLEFPKNYDSPRDFEAK